MELSAGALIAKLGMEQANVSQHLAVCGPSSLLESEGWQPSVLLGSRSDHHEVLNLMRTYFQAHLKEALAMLGEIEKPHEKVR